MKVEYKQPEFTPITLIIESQAELDALWIGTHIDVNSFRASARGVLSNLSEEELDSAGRQITSLWAALNQVRDEVKKS